MSDAASDPRISQARDHARASGYAVRPAVTSDARAIGHVHVEVWRATYAGLMRSDFLAGMDPEALARRWQEVLESHDVSVRICVGLDPQGRVVGFASAGPARDVNPPTAQELYAINVLPTHQGAGVAHLLMDAVVQPGPCSLWVAAGNARAEAFYRRYGFVADGRTMRDERSGVQELRMVREGPPPGLGGTQHEGESCQSSSGS